MTKKKVRPVPTDEDLVRIFTGQAFKDMVAANSPPGTDVERFANGALEDARVYINEAGKPPRVKTRIPLILRHKEAAIDFANALQVTYAVATGEMPGLTANRNRRGPFARILRKCLLLLQAPIDDVAYINILHERRGEKLPDVPE